MHRDSSIKFVEVVGRGIELLRLFDAIPLR